MKKSSMVKSETKKLGLINLVKEDIACVFERDPAARNTAEVLTTYPGVHAIIIHRITHRLWNSGWRYTARLTSFLSRVWTNIDIHPGATIGRRFFIDHGAGVVVGETAEIGNDVTLYHGVTLGGTSWNKGKRHPTLLDGVMVGAGAKILGPIVIGCQARVGANSVVIKDVPNGQTVVGIPGKVVQVREIGVLNPYGIDLDHHLIPDPVGKAISCLMERIGELEKQVQSRINPGNLAEEQCETCDAESLCEPVGKVSVSKKYA
jgi:serine O-acetyltransferase